MTADVEGACAKPRTASGTKGVETTALDAAANTGRRARSIPFEMKEQLSVFRCHDRFQEFVVHESQATFFGLSGASIGIPCLPFFLHHNFLNE